jgi:hypothetical protein
VAFAADKAIVDESSTSAAVAEVTAEQPTHDGHPRRPDGAGA